MLLKMKGVFMNLEVLEAINGITLKIGGFVMALSYFPQIIQILKNKTSEGISLKFIGMVTLALATFSFNGFIVMQNGGGAGTFISQLANLIPAIILVILIVVYKPEK